MDYIVENTLGKILGGVGAISGRPPAATSAKGATEDRPHTPLSILDWHRDQYTLDPRILLPDGKKTAKNSKGKNPVIYQTQGGELLEPFFKALGWNIDNEAGCSLI